jgi:SP family arabinose:H+ symporter-like MFS transporter
MNQQSKIFLWALSAALGGFLFGFDTAVISGVEQTLQKLWNLSVFEHGVTVSLSLIHI